MPPVQSYPSLPTFSQWKKDSAVGTIFSPKRSNDPTLLRIDRMVKSLNRLTDKWDSDDYFYKLGGLFFTTMYWNNNHKSNSQMDSRRRNPILRLNLYAANRLAQVHGCSIGGLATKLEQIYGTGMAQYGIDKDAEANPRYLRIKDRKRLRVMFRGGLGYIADCSSSTGISLDHSSDSYNMADNRFGFGYVFSMSNELYVVLFGSGIPFHSCLLGGAAVKCAGMISFNQGVVDRIKNDSGHYRPVDLSLAQMLRHFKTIGLNIARIYVETADGSGNAVETTGDKFLAANGNWAAIKTSARVRGHHGWRSANELEADQRKIL